ncbi:alpha/beta fold hydrolase [Nocardia niigatensis]|uniref:alpha/beta fold hydrolase n=1 Tax=Nocardia niigatensis TaxID=209249 RepID=UPI0005934DA5|nr:alpha/beta fold hydrolase [Nocardia niigatensis]
MSDTSVFEQRQIVVAGVRSPVLVGGLGDTDQAVVFVHGNPDAGGDWMPLLTEVATFARVIAPDMPGFGGAERRADQDYTVAAYAAHLAGVLDELGVGTAHLVAHDFGGPWALAWAAAHPGQVGSVTLINTGVLTDYRWHRMARLWRLPVIGELVQVLATPRVLRAVLRHDNPGLPTSWLERIVGHALPWGTKRAVLRLYRSTDTAAIEALGIPLRELDLPALVVWGESDVYIPVEQARLQLEVFPRARVETLAGVGHWAWMEQPDRVVGLVAPFLRAQLTRQDSGES